MADPQDTRDERADLPEAPPTRGKDQAVILGVFMVVGIIAILGALFVLTDAAIFRGRYIVTTHVPNAGGIRRGDPVQMRGVNVGRVHRFDISRERVAIGLEIEGEYEIPKDSYVELTSAGLLGGMVANVVPGKSTEMVEYGDVLPGRAQTGGLADAGELADRAEDVLARVQEILTPRFRENVHQSSAELQEALTQLSGTVTEQRQQLNRLTASLQTSASRVEQATAGGELERVMSRLDTISERLNEMATSLETSAQSTQTVVGRLEKGQGTLGKLSQDETLYDNLSQASVNMNQAIQGLNALTTDMRALVADIKKNPRRYFSVSVF